MIGIFINFILTGKPIEVEITVWRYADVQTAKINHSVDFSILPGKTEVHQAIDLLGGFVVVEVNKFRRLG